MRSARLTRRRGVEALALVRIIDVIREDCIELAQVVRAARRLADEDASHRPDDPHEPSLRRRQFGVAEYVSARRLQWNLAEIHYRRFGPRCPSRLFPRGESQGEAERPRLLKPILGTFGQRCRNQSVHRRRQLQRRKF